MSRFVTGFFGLVVFIGLLAVLVLALDTGIHHFTPPNLPPPPGTVTPIVVPPVPAAPPVDKYTLVTVVFGPGTAYLDDNAKEVIETRFGPVAKAYPHARVKIEGNADGMGSDESNDVLSLKRAQAVADFLVATYGLDVKNLDVVAKGAGTPVIPGGKPAEKNRRVDFGIVE